jgi:hypothetical protein
VKLDEYAADYSFINKNGFKPAVKGTAIPENYDLFGQENKKYDKKKKI